MSVRGTSSEVEYAYGTIRINSDGFADDEFDLSKDRRVGYIGDSGTYGVGAGHGYRISEILAELYPEFEHMNLGGIGLSLSEAEVGYVVRLAERFDLEKAIYLFNLNDILPDAQSTGAAPTGMSQARGWIAKHLDWFRGRSYLYTYLRSVVGNALRTRGVGFHGYAAYELHPEVNRQAIKETAQRISLLGRRLAERGTELVLVLLPYEMQISEEAARRYAEHGVEWESGFVEGSTQQILLEYVEPSIRHIDALYAFVAPRTPGASRTKNGLGEYFVYNKGDRLDWNHPNRRGHRAIAEYLHSQSVLEVD
jgi:hypothetical protein